MNRRSTGTATPAILDFTIREDELEHHRIQLEHNLQNTEISFHLSSSASSDNDEVHHHHQQPLKQQQRRTIPSQRLQKNLKKQAYAPDNSVELGRHLSEPSLQEIPSFVHRSRDHFTGEDIHRWSYRPDDDEEGVNPYGHESLSTVNHHASAVTLNAGLGGNRARRERSLSGAEYDPDRPLHAMIAGVNSKHSMFDLDPKSKSNLHHSMTVDPIVVDSTAELDRILESGHAKPISSHSVHSHSRSLQNASPISSGPSSSESSDHNSPSHPISPSRPKLTDHLRHVSFSPKRPRTAPPTNGATSPLTRTQQLVEDNAATPRPTRRHMPAFNTPAPQPEVRLHPATPSTGGGGGTSKFTRVSRSSTSKGTNGPAETGSLARHSNHAHQHRVVSRAVDSDPNPFGDLSYVDAPQASPVRAPPTRNATPRKSSLKDTSRSRVYLPDVTGLTAAVESPAKPGIAYYSIRAENKARESEARLLQTLQSVQNQLQDLEDENGISRRRVRELEMELEECKREVARERTRLLERELDSSYRQGKGAKGKGKARAGVGAGVGVIDDERLNERYNDVVEEKRALEALITSLRTHLTRLTAELASHQELLSELRRLRDTDSKALQEKGAEILRLSEEVQRLAGEVEVLRGVVEEGLKERRASREGEMVSVDMDQSPGDLGMSQDLEGEETEQEEEEEEDEPHGDEPNASEEEEETVDEHEEDEEEQHEQRRQRDPWGAPDMSMNNFAPTHATFGSNDTPSAPIAPKRMVDDVEMSRIVAEVEERRSNRSNTSIRLSSSPPPQSRAAQHQQRAQRKVRSVSTRVQVGNDTVAHDVDTEPEDVDDDEDRNPLFAPSQNNRDRSFTSSSPPHGFSTLNQNSRPSAPTPRHAAHHSYTHTRQRSTGATAAPTHNHHHAEEEEAHIEPEDSPFPQIRGEMLERLFFSAPEHNAQTCTVCYRRRQNPSSSPDLGAASRPRSGGLSRQGSQEGPTANAQGNGDAEKGEAMRVYLTYSSDPGYYHQIGRQYGLPAQTVVARVIRELEDDFTHYKSIYVELADHYKLMDAASDVLRRNTLAKHLKEVVDVLEQKGDQIASLYDLLSFKDKQTLVGNP
ncbi:hypothetical protein BJ165DRAFT_1518238 [Panaeolus papilionaceus]|nr:hypothetical protein BJ165DRAFT_1518238 [Panaeolus papilionaceus]